MLFTYSPNVFALKVRAKSKEPVTECAVIFYRPDYSMCTYLRPTNYQECTSEETGMPQYLTEAISQNCISTITRLNLYELHVEGRFAFYLGDDGRRLTDYFAVNMDGIFADGKNADITSFSGVVYRR